MRKLTAGCLAALMISVMLCPVLAAGEAASFGPEDELLHLYVLDLMAADCMLLQYKGQNLLIDVGGDTQRQQLKALLDWRGVREAAVFSSHPHPDHLGGLTALLEDITVSAFYTCFPEDERRERSVQPAAIKRMKEAGVPIIGLKDGDLLPFEEVELRVHQQAKAPILNDASAMLHLRFKKAAMLLTADISQGGQRFFSKRKELRADVMKAPHHGIERLQPRFLDAVRPEYVFVTHGSGDTKGTWGLLRQRKIPHFFATRGVIHFATDGSRWLAEQIGSSASLEPGESPQ